MLVRTWGVLAHDLVSMFSAKQAKNGSMCRCDHCSVDGSDLHRFSDVTDCLTCPGLRSGSLPHLVDPRPALQRSRCPRRGGRRSRRRLGQMWHSAAEQLACCGPQGRRCSATDRWAPVRRTCPPHPAQQRRDVWFQMRGGEHILVEAHVMPGVMCVRLLSGKHHLQGAMFERACRT